MKNTRKDIIIYLHDNLSEVGYEVCNEIFKEHWVTESLLCGGIPYREYGFLIPKKVNAGQSFAYIAAHAIGDSGHGRSLWQIDDRSYPLFVNKTPLSDIKAYMTKVVECLIEKETYLVSKGWAREKLGDELFERAVIAAYNCGQGNVHKALSRGFDPDKYTFGGDYSKDVQASRYLYYDLFIGPILTEAREATPSQLETARNESETEPVENKRVFESIADSDVI